MPASSPYATALRKIRPALFAAAGLSALVNILMLTSPLYMLQVYDRVLASGSVATLQGLFVLVIGLYAFLGLFDFLRGRILARAAHRLDGDLGELAFARWLQIPEGLRAQGAKAGGPAAQGLRDIETLRGFVASPALTGIMDLPWIPFYLGILFLVHPMFGYLTLAGAVVVILAALVNQRLADPGLADAGRHEAEERTFTEQGRRHAELIAAHGMAGRIAGDWRRLHDARLGAAQTAQERSDSVGIFSKTFRMFLQSAILSLAAWLVLRHEISSGMIIASSVISGRALAPIDQLIGQWKLIGRVREAHARGAESFPARPRSTALDLPAPTGVIRLSGVTKLVPGASSGSAARLLDRVSFDLEPGDALGVIGPSAAGKSVLARILVGAWAPEAGEIRFDGATPDQWEPETLGRHIGYLPQTAELLPGTIRDNIARFDPWAEDAQVIEAAKIAGVHEMILGLPGGYGTRTGAACPLSGGQIQRIGLARALFGLPRIVVLDEPNANLDQEGDAALTRAIATLRRNGSTVVVMAHRPSALAAVNKVMILQGGQVARIGSRDEILAPVGAAQAQASQSQAAQPQAAQAQSAQAQSMHQTPLQAVAQGAAGRAMAQTAAQASPMAAPMASPVAASARAAVSDRVEALLRASQGLPQKGSL